MKSAYDMNHVKSVKAVCIMLDGKPVGKIVANYSDNPNGSVVTATFSIWEGPLSGMEKTTTKAGGYGYDKFSSCVEQFLPGNKSVGCWKSAIEEHGYTVFDIL